MEHGDLNNPLTGVSCKDHTHALLALETSSQERPASAATGKWRGAVEGLSPL